MECPYCKKIIECPKCERRKILKNRDLKKYRKSDKGKIAQKKDYQKNREKYICRSNTFNLIKEGKIYLGKVYCRKCGIKNKKTIFQVHHEIYHKSRPQIIQDWKEGKIYFLCKECNNPNRV